MVDSVSRKRTAFRALHAGGCFVIPNPWDIGSARLLQQLGFSALASTSAGHAWTRGRADYQLTRDQVLAHLTELCQAVDVPVNADFETGFAREPERVADNVRLALATGVAGLSIEDHEGDLSRPFDVGLACERIRAARGAFDTEGRDGVLVARTEVLLVEPAAVSRAIDRLVAFAEAGADCLFAPGVSREEDIGAMVRAVSPKPLNVVMARPGPSLAELAALGVRRVSVGGALARVAWAAALRVAEELKAGNFDGLASAVPSARLNAAFATES